MMVYRVMVWRWHGRRVKQEARAGASAGSYARRRNWRSIGRPKWRGVDALTTRTLEWRIVAEGMTATDRIRSGEQRAHAWRDAVSVKCGDKVDNRRQRKEPEEWNGMRGGEPVKGARCTKNVTELKVRTATQHEAMQVQRAITERQPPLHWRDEARPRPSGKRDCLPLEDDPGPVGCDSEFRPEAVPV
jgi:hypothetical protein